ncbi:MAG: 3'(2'),5'-bisphosphate nucleotidase CysQ [Brevundimonas sp.]|uniref:3'(2'),5'-bisphosphate nucleotidase CysQ n=1 Tax=Brevundimonas sp. TaxID=1871086 RepID=UPI00391CEE74
MTLAADLDLLKAAAIEAGALAVRHRAQGLTIQSKPGGSPVTDADMAVDRWLREQLTAARPDHGWLSEETADNPERLSRRRILVADPIDGTVAFMKNKPWWSVALAIVEDGRPVAAVIHAPDLNETFVAIEGGGARLNGQPVTASTTAVLENASVLTGAGLLDSPKWPEPWPPMRVENRNSLAYRMALVASGAFDVAMALTPKWDWDVAAGALIAAEAGATVSDHHGRPWLFNRPDPRQPSLICAAPALHPLIIRRCRPIPLANNTRHSTDG